jgi:hypothetical protein
VWVLVIGPLPYSRRYAMSSGEERGRISDFVTKCVNYSFPILIMRDGRRLFAGDEQRKGDCDFYNDDSAVSMEGKHIS